MIDGVPVPSDSFDANNVMGFQSIEVLLGPQSTLGGRTAASGLINLTTRGPTDSPYAFVNTTATTDSEYRLEGFLSGPIGNGVEGSLDAYGRRTPYPITNLTLDSTTTQDVYGVRAKLKIAITDDLDLTLMGHYENTVSRGFNFVYIYITPGNTFLFPGSPFTQAVMLPGIKPSWQNLDYTSPVSTAGSTYRDTDYSAIINYRLPGGYTMTSTTAHTQENQHQVQDIFAVNEYYWTVLTGTPTTVFNNTQQQITTVSQTSEELKILSPADQTFSWLSGFFYSDTSVNEHGLRTFPAAPVNNFVAPTTDTYDLYGRSTLNVTPSTSLITGLRFNHDVIRYRIDQLASPQAYHSSGSATNNTLLGDIAVKQQLTSDVMSYVSYSRGYGPAAYNTAAELTSNSALAPVSRENIDSFEIGTKGSYLNRRVILNARSVRYDLLGLSDSKLFLCTWRAIANSDARICRSREDARPGGSGRLVGDADDSVDLQRRIHRRQVQRLQERAVLWHAAYHHHHATERSTTPGTMRSADRRRYAPGKPLPECQWRYHAERAQVQGYPLDRAARAARPITPINGCSTGVTFTAPRRKCFPIRIPMRSRLGLVCSI